MGVKSIKDFNVKDKKVLVRCDFNVPLDVAGGILDDFRILAALPTIKYLIEKKAKVILMSHLDPEDTLFVNPKFSLQPVAKKLSEILGVEVAITDDCIGQDAEKKVGELNGGQVLLLENLRFHMGESQNSDEFAKNLSALGKIYINEAFSVCHRTHASIVGVPKYLPHGAGLLLEKEIENLSKILKNPKRPLVAVIGGKKAGTKAKFIENISEIADAVIVGGLIKKEIEEEKLTFKNPKKIISPVNDLQALDIDEKTIEIFKEKILKAKTIIWNGPFGRFEDENFKNGTLKIAKAIVESKAFSVVGGGQTVEFLRKEGMIDQFSHVSTGGGAMLDYLSGEKLPGIEALK